MNTRFWAMELDPDSVPEHRPFHNLGLWGIVDNLEGGIIAYAPRMFAIDIATKLDDWNRT